MAGILHIEPNQILAWDIRHPDEVTWHKLWEKLTTEELDPYGNPALYEDEQGKVYLQTLSPHHNAENL
jgi:hypothetical protein